MSGAADIYSELFNHSHDHAIEGVYMAGFAAGAKAAADRIAELESCMMPPVDQTPAPAETAPAQIEPLPVPSEPEPEPAPVESAPQGVITTAVAAVQSVFTGTGTST